MCAAARNSPLFPLPDGRRNDRQGDGSMHDLQGFWNGGTTLANGIELYTFGGLSDRGGEATGFWRRPNDDRTLRNLYPDGFLPIIRSDIVDASGAIGARGVAKGWRYDLSGTYGGDRFGFTIQNTANNGGVWRLTAAYNNNGTRVVRVDSLPTDLRALQSQLFGRVERARIERGNPKTNLILTSNYNIKRANLLLRTQRFGPVTSFGTTASNAFGPLDQTFSAKWITDISAGYEFGRFTGTIGSDNVWDVYPDRNNNPGSITANNGGNANFGIFPYAGISPFGFNGRFIYARVSAGL